jgi:hypothetical protein
MNNNQSRIDWNQKVKTVLSDTTSTLELKKKNTGLLNVTSTVYLKIDRFYEAKILTIFSRSRTINHI